MDKTKIFYFEYHFNKSFLYKKKIPNSKQINKKNYQIYLFGEPLFQNNNLENLLNKNTFFLSNNFLKKINGEFLLIFFDKKKKILYLANDRFTSIPVYYYCDNNTFYFSNNYLYLYRKINKKNNLKLNPKSFLEFLLFRKLHGNKTFDQQIKYLDFATKIKINNKLNFSRYWFPNFKKINYKNLKDCSGKFINLLSNAIQNKIDKKKPINLFLSGGLDTRVVLASLINLKYKPRCFTFGYNKQSEYFYAKKLTKLAKLKHFFLRIDKNEIIKNLKYKLLISSGMYNHFINFFSKHKINFIKHSDNTFHGHGFDYMFQGMYMPKYQFKLFNKETHLKLPISLEKEKDLVNYYFYNSSYKTRYFDLKRYLNKNKERHLEKELIVSLKRDFKEIKKIKSNFDKWEFFLIKNIFRHYSHLDVISISEYGSEKKITFDNDLFDYYLSLKHQFRFDGRMLKHSLKILNNEFAEIKSANHGMKITSSSTILFLKSILNKFLYILTKDLKFKHPSNFRRTFPNLDEQILNSRKIQSKINSMFYSKDFKQFLYFLNFDNLFEDYLLMLKNKKKNFGQILFLLLHLYNLKKYLN